MRDVLRGTLGRSLRTLSDEDRLVAAWTVACGPALAERATVLGLDDERVLHVRVLQPEWREQFAQMRSMLAEDLRKIAGVPVQTIHFEGHGPKSAGERKSAPREPKKPTDGRAKERRKNS